MFNIYKYIYNLSPVHDTHRHTHTPLLLDDVLQPRHHLLRGQWPEAKPGAAGLQGWDDLGQVVADQTEAGVFSELLYHWRELAVGGWGWGGQQI